MVRWFCPDRGFGFVVPDDGGPDRFVTFSALPGSGFRALEEGQRVTFLPAEDGTGPIATSVQLA
jgi:CspA family cold shock protein